MMICRIYDPEEKRIIASKILNALPDWFGIPESTEEYIRNSMALPMLAATENGRAAGFVAMKENSPFAGEIYVMGVLQEYHRRGTGRALAAAAEEWCAERGHEFMEVKTLDQSNPDKYYAKTRAFYSAVGFRPLECLPTLWDEANPCLIMIKDVKKQ